MGLDVGVNVLYQSNTEKLRSEWDTYVAYTREHPPGGNVAPLSPTGHATATTFGGNSTIAPPTGSPYGAGIFGSISGNTVTTASATAQQAMHSSAAANAQDLVSRLAQQSGSPSGVQGGSGQRMTSSSSRSLNDMFGTDLAGMPSAPRRSQMLETLTEADLYGGSSRRRIRSELGQEGLRGIGRYLSAYGIAEFSGNVMGSQNKYRLAMAGASSVDDVIGAQRAYQSDSPYANIPIVGSLGSAGREFIAQNSFGWIASNADIVSSQASRRITAENSGMMGSLASSKLGLASQTEGLQGTHAGDIASIQLSSQAAIVASKVESSTKRTEIAEQIAALDFSKWGFFGANPVVIDKIGGLQEQKMLVDRKSRFDIAAANQQSSLQQAASNRSYSSSMIGLQYGSEAIEKRFGSSYQSERAGIVGQYGSMYQGEADPDKRSAITRQYFSALGNQDKEYTRDTSYLGMDASISANQLQVKALTATHRTLAATLASINGQILSADKQFAEDTGTLDRRNPIEAARYDKFDTIHKNTVAGLRSESGQATADYRQQAFMTAGQSYAGGLRAGGSSLQSDLLMNRLQRNQSVYSDPDRSSIYDSILGVDNAASRLGNAQQHLGVGYEIDARNRSIEASRFQGQFMPRASQASSEISGDMLSAQQFNISHLGPEWADQRAANTASLIGSQKQSLENLKFLGQIPGNAEQVSGLTSFGDFSNQGYKDYQNALSVAGGGGAAIQGESDSSTNALGPQMDQLQQALQSVATVIEKWLGLNGGGG